MAAYNAVDTSQIISERVDLAIQEKICDQLFCTSILEMLNKFW